MPSRPLPDTSPKHTSPLRAASTPASSVSDESPSSSYASSINIIPFSILSVSKSYRGDEVDVHFSDELFTFPTQWLYQSRTSEGLPSPDGCKNPSRIHVRGANVTGVGIRTTVDITWNTGTTSPFPALWLRVFGPTEALEQEHNHDPPLALLAGKDPRRGVEQLTLAEKRVADRYRAMLVGAMKEFVDEDWLVETPTSLLREMVRFVEVDLQRKIIVGCSSSC